LLVVLLVDLVVDMVAAAVVLVDLRQALLQSEHIQYQQLFRLVLVVLQ
tara:strand:+ start:1158 stop:1301 length:144 start_codon:yes stop_codon:yes gene_type:complete